MANCSITKRRNTNEQVVNSYFTKHVLAIVLWTDAHRQKCTDLQIIWEMFTRRHKHTQTHTLLVLRPISGPFPKMGVLSTPNQPVMDDHDLALSLWWRLGILHFEKHPCNDDLNPSPPTPPKIDRDHPSPESPMALHSGAPWIAKLVYKPHEYNSYKYHAP